MDETAFRILDTLSRDPGRAISISDLSREIKRLHGTAYYSNTNKSLHRLRAEGIVQLARAGNSWLASLDLSKPQAIDALSEMELHKRRALLAKRDEFRRLFDSLSSSPYSAPTALIEPEKNIKLNRAELLIQLPEGASATGTETILAWLGELGRRLNIRLDILILDGKGFQSLLAEPDKNALKEMLSRQTALLAADLFWAGIRNAWAHGIRIQFDRGETNPAKMSERDLVHNLARFGYSELGSPPSEGTDFGIEYLVTALLLKGDARRTQAIPVILAKSRPNYPLLLFLSKKYGVEGHLYGLLRAQSTYDQGQDLRDAIRALDGAGVAEIRANKAGIQETMRTYNAIPKS